jgi:Nod factor-specific ABC transporter NodJ protein
MLQIIALVYREMIIFRRKFLRYFFQFTISPLLYLIAFGWAGNGRIMADGTPYIQFILPGLIAMSSMTNSFSISTEINIARFYWRTFDEIRSAPVADWAYVCGEAFSGMVRGTFAAVVVMVLGMLFGAFHAIDWRLFGGIALNAFVFSSIAVSTAMLARSHADQGMLSTFVITPMAFLCGTFFPVESYPLWIGRVVSLLPLTHASNVIRAAALGREVPGLSLLYLLCLSVLAFSCALMVVGRSRN